MSGRIGRGGSDGVPRTVREEKNNVYQALFHSEVREGAPYEAKLEACITYFV